QDRYATAMVKLAKAEKELSNFKKDASTKGFRLEVKKLINTRVGQISATWSRIQECTLALRSLLSKHEDPGIQKTFVEHAVASRFADDAEVSVRSQPRAAWSIAEVGCRVFGKHPAVQELFIGLICRECPYVRADFSAQGQQDVASIKRQQEAFTEMVDRMVSYHRLWVAVFTTQGELGVIWNWMARTLNHSPSTAAVALIHATLDMVGADAQVRYKKQFDKLIHYIDERYLAHVVALQSQVKGEEADRLRASHNRLSRWVQDFKLNGRAFPPEGRQIRAHQESELNPNI
ncbi:Nucleoporin GLE1 (GLE1-like protein), partial [Durusdinium trenchii]